MTAGRSCQVTRISSDASRARRVRIGDYHRNDIADVVRLVRRHYRIRLERRLGPVGVGDRSEAGHSAEIGEIVGDVNSSNARRGACRFDILDAKLRVPVRAAQKNRFEFGLVDRIGGVITPPAYEANVLEALDALTHAEFCRFHIHILSFLAAARWRRPPAGVRALTSRILAHRESRRDPVDARCRNSERRRRPSARGRPPRSVAKRPAACYHPRATG